MSSDLPGSVNIGTALLKAGQGGSLKAAAELESAKQVKDLEKIDEAAREFEAVFIAEMMKPMFENLDTAPPFGGGKAEEIFRSIMLQEYGKQIAETGQVGIAQHVKAELLRIQEAK